MNLTLKVWRQPAPNASGPLVEYEARDISPDMSFLEMLDVVNERLILKRRDADRVRSRLPRGDLRHVRHHDQRRRPRADDGHGHLPAPHADLQATATWSSWSRGARALSRWCAIWWWTAAHSTASSRPADMSRVNTGSAPDGNAIPVPEAAPMRAMDAAACIGCGACVAACPNGSASLFTGSQDHPPRPAASGPAGAVSAIALDGGADGRGRLRRVQLFGECQEACPKEISIETISRMNRDYLYATLTARPQAAAAAD